MAQILILLAGAAAALCAVWTNLLLAMGASTTATILIGILILACCFLLFMMMFEEWPMSANVPLWSVPIVASSYAVGAPPTPGSLAWYATCAVISTILLTGGKNGQGRSVVDVVLSMLTMTSAILAL